MFKIRNRLSLKWSNGHRQLPQWVAVGRIWSTLEWARRHVAELRQERAGHTKGEHGGVHDAWMSIVDVYLVEAEIVEFIENDTYPLDDGLKNPEEPVTPQAAEVPTAAVRERCARCDGDGRGRFGEFSQKCQWCLGTGWR